MVTPDLVGALLLVVSSRKKCFFLGEAGKGIRRGMWPFVS